MTLDKLLDDSVVVGSPDLPVYIQRQPHPLELELLKGAVLADSTACPNSFERYYRIFIIHLDCLDSSSSVFKYCLQNWTW